MNKCMIDMKIPNYTDYFRKIAKDLTSECQS